MTSWKEKTNAMLLPECEFDEIKRQQRLYVVGVAGFSEQWSARRLASNHDLAGQAECARRVLRRLVVDLHEAHGRSLVLSSGATAEGVPGIVYEICAELSVLALGVAPRCARSHALGELSYLVLSGDCWGDGGCPIGC